MLTTGEYHSTSSLEQLDFLDSPLWVQRPRSHHLVWQITPSTFLLLENRDWNARQITINQEIKVSKERWPAENIKPGELKCYYVPMTSVKDNKTCRKRHHNNRLLSLMQMWGRGPAGHCQKRKPAWHSVIMDQKGVPSELAMIHRTLLSWPWTQSYQLTSWFQNLQNEVKIIDNPKRSSRYTRLQILLFLVSLVLLFREKKWRCQNTATDK